MKGYHREAHDYNERIEDKEKKTMMGGEYGNTRYIQDLPGLAPHTQKVRNRMQR
jgi:hypothetical protein